MNHASSSASLRDRLLFPGRRLDEGLERLRGLPALSEALVLSTCNRVEIYGVAPDPLAAREALLRFQADFHGIAAEEFRHATYFYHCAEAVRHLYEVVASLDSMVIGESQILGQVKEAYAAAAHAGATGTYLNKLFHFAVEAGKRVARDTRINAGPVSLPSVAVEHARRVTGRLEGATALVIGAGEMSMLTARHLRSAGVGTIYFVNRTRERGIETAARFGGTALPLSELPGVLERSDVVVSATAAPHYVIDRSRLTAAMANRGDRPILLIDIAAPRDIDPTVGELPNVHLYGIDELRRVAADNTRRRAGEIAKARKLLAEEIDKYFSWYHSLEVVPTLVALRRRFEELCEEELERYEAALAGLPDETRELVRQLAVSLTRRYLRTPCRVLKEKGSGESAGRFTDTIADLFDLEVSDGH